MILLLTFFLSVFARAEGLEVVSVEYHPTPQAVSCGLLHQRELEREKVIRELAQMIKSGLHGQPEAMLLSNNMLTNKLFMPNEVWRDLSAEVLVAAKISDRMLAELERGQSFPFISVIAPGFVWESYANQLPDEMSIEIDKGNRLVRIHYAIYLNVLCSNPRDFPKIDWRPNAS